MVNNTTIGVKKSQFNASTTISDSATFDFVEGGSNKKITYANLLPLLGATGTITQVGDPSGTPVLDPQGSVNGIRNLVGGAGIDIDVTLQNGIEISTSFTFDQSGEALVVDPASQNPDFKSLLAGNDVSLSSDDDAITIALDRSGVVPENQVVVNNPSDFPAAVSGVRTLASNTEYLIGASIDVGSDRFVLSPGTVITGLGTGGPSFLTSSTTGALFTANDVGFVNIFRMRLSVPNGDIFAASDSGTRNTVLSTSVVTVVGCKSVGVIQNIFAINMQSWGVFGITTNGFSIPSGQIDILSLRQVALFGGDASTIFLDLGTSLFPALEVRDLLVNGASGAIGISGLASNGNIPSGATAVVEGSEFQGGVTPLQNISSQDFRWLFSNNTGINDTNPLAFVTMNGNSTETVITTAGVPVKVAGTFVEQMAPHFTTDATGRITYNGERGLCVSVDILLSSELASGTNDASVVLALNGTVISDSAQQQELAAGDPRTMNTIWEIMLNENDYLEIFIQNDDTTSNITVRDAKFRVK